jgi:hypothetical protein
MAKCQMEEPQTSANRAYATRFSLVTSITEDERFGFETIRSRRILVLRLLLFGLEPHSGHGNAHNRPVLESASV